MLKTLPAKGSLVTFANPKQEHGNILFPQFNIILINYRGQTFIGPLR